MGLTPMILACVGLLGVLVAQIWLYLLISKESKFAGLAFFLVPPVFGYLFAKDHWNEARRPVMLWIGGFVLLLIGLGLALRESVMNS